MLISPVWKNVLITGLRRTGWGGTRISWGTLNTVTQVCELRMLASESFIEILTTFEAKLLSGIEAQCRQSRRLFVAWGYDEALKINVTLQKWSDRLHRGARLCLISHCSIIGQESHVKMGRSEQKVDSAPILRGNLNSESLPESTQNRLENRRSDLP